MSKTIQEKVDQLYRSYSGKLITYLLHYFRLAEIKLAEDLVQETYLSALVHWKRQGIPEHPEAWLLKVCKNKALNALKKQKKSPGSLYEERISNTETQREFEFSANDIRSQELRLLFALCHPDFSPKARIILTLKTLAGFKTKEIAQGLSMKEESVKKNLQRSRQMIREKNMPLKTPYVLQSRKRLDSVHQVLYLIFNEGYFASRGSQVIRKELCWQALRMMRDLLDYKKIATQDSQALFALMLLNVARINARPKNEALESQNRDLWDKALIQKGILYFNQSRKAVVWSRYHFEAAIASIHCQSPSFEATNWSAIVFLYDHLLKIQNDAFIRLNREIAFFYRGNQVEALENLTKIKELENHFLYQASLGKMNETLHKPQAALEAYQKALGFAPSEYQKNRLRDKIEKILLVIAQN